VKLAVQRRESQSRRQTATDSRRQEQGYVLLTLLLMVALMGIFALTAIIPIKFEIQRDQETEMIHRGVQYSRAIRAYYKKFGRYPTKLEDLDNTNNLRYLRKHYTDPLNKNKDFKLLHFGEPGVTMAGGMGMGGGSIPGASPAGSPGGLGGPGQSSSAFGGSGLGGGSGFGNSGAGSPGAGNSGVNSSGVFAQSSGFGGNSSSGFGASSNSPATPGQPGTSPAAGSDPTQASGQVAPGTAQGETSSSGQQLIASGPIVGVASISKKDTIREFNKKKKYNEWQFLYDPSADRGGLITTPYQPALQSFNGAAGQNNLQPGSNTSNSPGQSPSGQSSFGQSSFGQSGFGNSSSPGGSTTPVQPAPISPPQQ
jgi:type II secretory pathway pseudopilin PulG